MPYILQPTGINTSSSLPAKFVDSSKHQTEKTEYGRKIGRQYLETYLIPSEPGVRQQPVETENLASLVDTPESRMTRAVQNKSS